MLIVPGLYSVQREHGALVGVVPPELFQKEVMRTRLAIFALFFLQLLLVELFIVDILVRIILSISMLLFGFLLSAPELLLILEAEFLHLVAFRRARLLF